MIFFCCFADNLWSNYLAKDEVCPGVKGDKNAEVIADMSSNFIVLAAIYFPSVTGKIANNTLQA